ncbi:DDB1- and CUL4-associated factor 8 isoform X1 [Frankliniella occidentalis]|uniref:DDB1- and CUL4-associated factor 8 isoform X1 n=1 Tax=Frankliniella occidentalis TaxID=133901 RepID=A0A6J1SNG6_FRAOC|nr:DDB1- and CUL4-associated factor 8 isoform X1 [Frankliniella occidentalis]XP_026282324.1 DDB1- and CUL4-associated factor 8 isoform X1 [Frankliniella occidentalis]XP_026282326.1 DDB1- and CUL4-associated factor 8 isoform X1 [Frankliniella occidentalis]
MESSQSNHENKPSEENEPSSEASPSDQKVSQESDKSSKELLCESPASTSASCSDLKKCESKDTAIPGSSSDATKLPLSLKAQRARKRERCDDDDDDCSDTEDCRRSGDAGAHPERQGDQESRGETNESTPELCPFITRTRTRHRRYRRRLNDRSSSSSSPESSSDSSSDERPHDAASTSSAAAVPDDSDSSGDSSLTRSIFALHRGLHATQRFQERMGLDSDDTWSHFDSDDSESDAEEGAGKEENEEEKKYNKCLSKEVPKHKWNVTTSVINRQIGMRTHQQEPQLFQQHCYGSLHCVKRLELMYKLDEHRGCVNAISFNQSGTRLASGSDDKKIIVWDWAIGKSILTYSSGHNSNVFQAKFLPMSGDNHIVSSARDGQVRLAVLSSTGECRSTRRLAHHRKPVNKLALLPETPHVFLSAGEDGRVMAIDVRGTKQTTLVTVEDGTRRKIGLYSVDAHPLNSDEFCVCGVDYFIRVYDKRKIDLNGAPMKKFCPSHIYGTNKYTTVTCALYNHDGSEIIGSYNDESLYLFDSRHSDGADFVHKYEGHRNSVTVKSCDFFGPNSEYIMSGSDCGNIYFWDKNTEAIVQFMRGDEKGVVNALVGHPQFPILATSGLDSDVKIWVPSCEQDPEMKDLKRVVSKNMRARVIDQPYRMDVFESHMEDLDRQFGVNIRHLGGSQALQLVRLGAQFRGNSNPGSSSSDSSDSDGYANPLQCPTS